MTMSPISWKSVFLFPLYFIFGEKTVLFFFQGKVFFYFKTAGYGILGLALGLLFLVSCG